MQGMCLCRSGFEECYPYAIGWLEDDVRFRAREVHGLVFDLAEVLEDAYRSITHLSQCKLLSCTKSVYLIRTRFTDLPMHILGPALNGI